MNNTMLTSVGDEIRIKINSGYICFDSAHADPNGCSYVRFLDADKYETAYWASDEWRDAPEKVMGAVMGALCELAANLTLVVKIDK